MAETSWDDLAAGRGCPFDAPRPDASPHWDLVAKLGVSSWYLPVNQQYRGHGILVFDPRHATRLDAQPERRLAPDDRANLLAALRAAP